MAEPSATTAPALLGAPSRVGGTSSDDELVARAEALAERLLSAATSTRSRRERTQGARIARLLEDPAGLAFVLALTDEVLRIRDPPAAARHLAALVRSSHTPTFLGPLDRLLLAGGVAAATRAPTLVIPLVRARVRAELSGFVIDAEPRRLRRYLAAKRREGVACNLNLLGEAVLGDEEAARRLDAVLALLRRPDVRCVSVKVSSVSSQLHVEAFEHEVDRVAGAIRRLYDEAMAHTPPKMVNLDMEEYRDLDLTVAVFRRVLDEPRYRQLPAGIVLQAYVPDALAVLEDLAGWARARHRSGGGAIRVRIVKGANLAMEKVESELGGWPEAPFPTKAATDAHYKRMLDAALDPANRGALRIGVASHNLFEVAWALTVARQRGLEDMIEPEMLQGMAPSIAAAVHEEAGRLLLYAPVAPRNDSESVIAYLVRRFDENTGPDNFLRRQFDLAPGSPAWAGERRRFEESVRARHQPPPPTLRGAPAAPAGPGFANQADTDVAVRRARERLAGACAPLAELGIGVVPAVVAGERIDVGRWAEGSDPGAPGVVAYRFVDVDEGDARRAVHAAGPAGERWRARPLAERLRLVAAAGDALEADRMRLLGVMARDGGKTFAEADAEVSEAVDFARWYAACGAVAAPAGARFDPYRTVVVVPPWNFPLAIPAGGVLAALAAGSAVILKPAPETVAVAWALAEACWASGIPEDVMQFVPCTDGDASRALVTDPAVDAVILTGSWDTARMMLAWRPGLRLHAETSGKNAIVVTAAADLDAAVADLVRSAFGHAGQKCSAASLAIVEASVYDDPRWRRQLSDAVRTLRPGPAWDPATTMGPLVRAPGGPLADALTRLETGEEWLVRPSEVGGPQLWSPGVKLGVAPQSPFHLTECFGPVLGVMRAADLAQAVAWQNAPAYGLTAGLHSLDPDEIAWWRDRVQAGNLYVNRHTTGAVVRRQPFGGWKRSAVGPGAKAGGAHYVASLGEWTAEWPGSVADFEAAVARVLRTGLAPADPSGLASEANVVRHLPLPRVLVRAGGATRAADLYLALAAGRAVGAAVTLSTAEPLAGPTLPAAALAPSAVVVEDDDALCARLGRVAADKLRLLGGSGDRLLLAAHDAGLFVDTRPVCASPEIEVLRWVREQAISETRHRHGNITGRHPGPEVGAPA